MLPYKLQSHAARTFAPRVSAYVREAIACASKIAAGQDEGTSLTP